MTPSLAQVLWQSPGLAPAAVALLGVLAAAVMIFYPPQTRGVPNLWRWVMPALRGMAVAALAAAVMQPVVLRPRTAARQGALLILVDRSHSMSVVDRDRSPAELVALAAGLGAVSAEARAEAAPGLRTRLDGLRSLADQVTRSRSEAEYARVSGRGGTAATARLQESAARLRAALASLPDRPDVHAPPELAQRVAELKHLPPALDDAVLRALRTAVDAAGKALAASQAQADEQLFARNASVRVACTELGSLTREQLLEAGLTQGGGLLQSLPAGTPLVGFSFSGGTAELRPLRMEAGVSSASLTIGDVDGARSDIAGALRAALNRMAGRAVQAIVLLSDGRQVGDDAAGPAAAVEAIASDVSASGVPVFAVQTSAAGPRRDVSIVNVAAPASARVGQRISVRVDLRGPGFHGATVDVRLDAQNVRQIKRVTIGEEGTASADFDVQFSGGGPQALIASVLPLAGETSDQNNRFERPIKIGGEAARVLVIAGADAGRQYASVHAVLSRCAWVSLREVEQEEVASLTPRAILAESDVVVLVDLPPSELGDGQWTALEQLVRQRGGSVIVCAGKHAPMEYARHPLASRFLPYEASHGDVTWRTWPAEEPQFRIVPPAVPSSAVDDVMAAEGDFWRQLPPVARYVPLSPLNSDARALLIERESGAAVLTDTRRGLGHVYVLGTDQSWRWRGGENVGAGAGAGAGAGDEREQFWPQLVRVAAGEPYAAATGGLALDASDLAPEPEQPLVIRARVHDLYGQPVDAPTQTLRILPEGSDTPVREVAMMSLGEGSGRYEASVSGLPGGRYTLRLLPPEDLSTESQAEAVELKLTVAPRLEAEMADVSGDDRILRRLADASGGQFLTLERFNTLAARLAENRQKQSRLVEYTLWDSPYLFGFVLACLSAEWALRKKFGLA